MNADLQPCGYILVGSGLHAGARLELVEPDRWYSAGGHVHADYWLADTELAEARLEFISRGGVILLRLVEGPEPLIGTLSAPAGVELVIDAPVTWGGVSFRAVAMPAAAPAPQPHESESELAANPQDTPARLRKWLRGAPAIRPARVGLVLLSVVAIAAPLFMLLSVARSISTAYEQSERQSDALQAQQAPEARSAAARAAAQRLADLIGMQSISVMAADARTLALSGSDIPFERRESIKAAIAQFEVEYVVRDNIMYREKPHAGPTELLRLPEGVDTASYGFDGHLRGRNGTTYLVGSTLPDGSRIESIDNGRIWLLRGSERSVMVAPILSDSE
jgi:hypothetical protein